MALDVPNLDKSNEFSTASQGALAAGYLILTIAATIGNLCVFIINFRYRGGIATFRITSIFLLNLAATDLGIAIGNLPFAFISICWNRWIFGKVFCVINGFIAIYLPTVSIITILMITLHRAVVVLQPFKQVINTRRAIGACVFSWLWCLVVPMPPLFGISNYEYSPDRGFCRVAWVQLNTNQTLSTTLAHAYTLLSVSVFVIIPLCIISILNVTLLLTSCRLRMSAPKPTVQKPGSRRRSSIATDQKAFRTVSLVVGAFILCWLPQVVLVFLGITRSHLRISPEVGTFQAILVMANSTMNPFIYMYVNKDFRTRFVQILLCYAAKYRLGDGFHHVPLECGSARHKNGPTLVSNEKKPALNSKT